MSDRAIPARRAVQRLLVNGILGATARIATGVGTGEWRGVSLLAERRRVLLFRLVAQCGDRESSWLQALRAAIEESDRALAVMATGATAGAGAGGRPVPEI